MASMDTQPAPLGDGLGLDPYASFRVESARDVAALMRQLCDAAAPIQLSSPSGATLHTVIWSADAQGQRISLRAESDDLQLPALIEDDEATAVAYLDAVKLQFDLHDLVLVHGERASALQARMPRRVWRFQRRQSYRVRTPERNGPIAHLRHPALPDMALQLRVLDVSSQGCALLLPADVPALSPGTLLQGVRLNLDAGTRIVAALRLQHVSSTQSQAEGLRLGCEISGLDGDAERALQRYIDQTQKRRRLLSLP